MSTRRWAFVATLLLAACGAGASSREMMLDVFAAQPARGYGSMGYSWAEGPYQGLPGSRSADGFASDIERLSRAVEKSKETLGERHPQTGYWIAGLAFAHLAVGDYAAALRLQRLAIDILAPKDGVPDPRTPGSRQEADYRLSALRAQLGRLWLSFGQYRDARQEFQYSLDIVSRQYGEEHATTAERQILLASALVAEGEYARGLAMVQRGLRIRQAILQRPDCITLQGSTVAAAALDGLGNPDKAIEDLSAAIELLRAVSEPGNRNPNAICRAVGHTSLGALQFGAGRYADSLANHRRALAILDEALGPESESSSFVHLSIAEVLDALGQAGPALDEARPARSVLAKKLGPEHPRTAWASAIVARALVADGQPGTASAEASAALAALEKTYGPDHPRLARALTLLARDSDRLGDGGRADFTERALAIVERTFGAGHPATTPALAAASRNAAARGDEAAALDLAKRAFLASRGTTAIPDRLAAEDALFESLAEAGERAAAIAVGKLAVNSMQALRHDARSLDASTRRTFLEKGSSRYRRLADLLVEAGRLAEASEVLSMLKEEEYSGFIRRAGTADPQATKASLTDAEGRTVTQWEEASRGLVALAQEYETLRRRILAEAAEPAQRARLSELEARLAEGRRAFDALLGLVAKELASMTPQRASEIGAKGLENLRAFQGILRDLGPGAVLLSYVSLEKDLLILVTTPRSQVARRSALPAAELNRLVQRLRAALLNPRSDPLPHARELHRRLVAPVAEDLEQAGASTLMFSLDGALRYVPMATLHDGERYLVERYRIVVHTEAARERLRDRPLQAARVAGMGTTRELPGFSPLPSVPRELGAIARTPATPGGALPGKIVLDEAFTTKALKSALAEGYPIIHLASHFAFRPGTFDDSFLLLGDGSHLTLRQFRDESFELHDVDLLTLSACDTGIGGGGDRDGREVDGLGTLAQRQGARSVLATLWGVADEATATLMSELYRYRAEGKLDKAEALRQAQIAMLRGTAEADAARPRTHPFYWAPFILMGNWQ